MKIINLISQYIDLENKKVLDIGCHNGSFDQIFLDKHCKVVGIDIDNKVKIEILDNPNFSFEEISIDKYSTENKFDLIFARNVLPFSNKDLFENFDKIKDLSNNKSTIFFTYFGNEEIWGSQGKVKTASRSEMDSLIDKFKNEFELKYFSEEKYEGPDMAKNIKFWHIFTLILKKK